MYEILFVKYNGKNLIEACTKQHYELFSKGQIQMLVAQYSISYLFFVFSIFVLFKSNLFFRCFSISKLEILVQSVISPLTDRCICIKRGARRN